MTTHDHNSTPSDGPFGGPSGGDAPREGAASQFQSSESQPWEFEAWSDGLTSGQLALQADLSCLVDGELDESAAARVMVQLEESPECRSFFDDIKKFSRCHLDLGEPERVEARIAMLGSQEIARAAADVDLTHRLATIFYQLGKAYTLAALDIDGFANRVFEAAVPVDQAKTRGRGFVDGVVASGRLADRPEGNPSADVAAGSPPGGRAWRGHASDWTQARHLLNGRLEKIEEPLEKGRRLLEQAVEIDPSHEEARIYLACILGVEGKSLRAAELYREVFDTAISLPNRGHAAMQLGRLYFGEDDFRMATVFWRWITIIGLDREDARFALANLNLGHVYLKVGNEQRSLDSYRRLMDLHLDAGGKVHEVAQLFVDNDDARELFAEHDAEHHGFLARLTRVLPELLAN